MIFLPARTVATVAILLWLAGCAAVPPQPAIDRNTAWQRQQEQLDRLTDWDLAGRLSVQLESEGWSASLYWRQQDDGYRLRIVAPLGRGTVEITGDGGTVTLRTADNRVLQDGDIDELMQANLGWRVPVDALVYWIRGLPNPAAAAEGLRIDGQGRLEAVDQSGWSVRYERYMNSGGYEVPARMTVQRERLKLRLSINRWTLNDAS